MFDDTHAEARSELRWFVAILVLLVAMATGVHGQTLDDTHPELWSPLPETNITWNSVDQDPDGIYSLRVPGNLWISFPLSQFETSCVCIDNGAARPCPCPEDEYPDAQVVVAHDETHGPALATAEEVADLRRQLNEAMERIKVLEGRETR